MKKIGNDRGVLDVFAATLNSGLFQTSSTEENNWCSPNIGMNNLAKVLTRTTSTCKNSAYVTARCRLDAVLVLQAGSARTFTGRKPACWLAVALFHVMNGSSNVPNKSRNASYRSLAFAGGSGDVFAASASCFCDRKYFPTTAKKAP